MRNYLAFTFMLVAVVIMAPSASSEPAQQSVLTGLQGVFLRVQFPDSTKSLTPGFELSRDGLTAEMLQSTMELRLRSAGIDVLSITPGNLDKQASTLWLDFSYLKNPNLKTYAIAVTLALRESVIPERLLQKKATKVAVVTDVWRNMNLVFCSEGSVKDTRSIVADMVDSFANDYLAANPKRSQSK